MDSLVACSQLATGATLIGLRPLARDDGPLVFAHRRVYPMLVGHVGRSPRWGVDELTASRCKPVAAG